MKSKVNPKLLDEIREAHNLKTDLELASFLRIAPSTLSGIRNGTNPKLTTAMIIFDAAGVTDLRQAVIRSNQDQAA
ncbi:helix-turn-helix transcriptional regulator [Corynebacterium callunae]|uniref:helix-turn-helix domain-containing protein n=1 Tax=Corynebacterium callunae TaxID=1721 RepID=UPI0039824D37